MLEVVGSKSEPRIPPRDLGPRMLRRKVVKVLLEKGSWQLIWSTPQNTVGTSALLAPLIQIAESQNRLVATEEVAQKDFVSDISVKF